MDDFKSVKDLYEDGYRCIYYDNNECNPTIYLKNFNSEDSKAVQFTDEGEFSQFKDYIDNLRMS